MDNNLIKVNPEEIAYVFYVDNKKYVAIYDTEDKDNIYFALAVKLDEKHEVFLHVPEDDMEKVAKAFDKEMEFFDSVDELDEESEEI